MSSAAHATWLLPSPSIINNSRPWRCSKHHPHQLFEDISDHLKVQSKGSKSGRQLYESAFGTPVCQCPDGTYEVNNDSYDTVCEPILSMTGVCPPGKVLWFRDFSLPPECLPDPCGGKNLYRGPNELPFVPFASDYGKCYQLGQMSGVCPAPTWYSLALDRLQGVCSTLEDAGYQVFDSYTLSFFSYMYGPPIPREGTVPLSSAAVPYKMTGTTVGPYGPSTVSGTSMSMYGNGRGSKYSVDASSGQAYDEATQPLSKGNVVKGELIAYLKGLMDSASGPGSSLDFLQAPSGHKFHEFFKIVKAIMSDLVSGRSHHRSRRAPLPHATPGNVIETRLVGCRAGAQRDINAKCRDTILPARPPFDRVTRAAPPVPPQPGCPGGQVYNLQRICTPGNSVASSISAANLG
ncbi:uncharacterized protein [Procambarus clarkii]|uniref:uncharacterized protein isoform X2 n=1 Tax=Procambarus clarkii TaxID=6728 RepID=UPI001E6713BF|nr:uncharacterized protein LOC123754542 [Procambarus clarkii]